jgi:heme/copper-type cytochrome/quinol oxidase subunit 2
MSRVRLLSLLPFVAVALAVWLVPLPFSTTPVTHQVTLAADQFAFDPPVLHINRGDRIRLTLQAGDVVHGFYLDGYGLETRLHPFMIGELVVGPNWPFVRAVGLVLVATAATLFYLRRFPS